jgi:hypothetical protein
MIKRTSLLMLAFIFAALQTNAGSNLKLYYRYTNKAELAICGSKPDEACRLYKKAFQYLEFPFTMDVKNAFRVCYSCNEPVEELTAFVSQLKKKGDSITDLVDTTDRDYRYYALLDFQGNVKSTVIPELAEAINSLQQADQNARKACPAYQEHCVHEVMRIDSLNMLRLVGLFRKYGTIIEENAGSHSLWAIEILQQHSNQWLNYHLRENLKQQMLAGTFDARRFSFIEDIHNMYEHRIAGTRVSPFRIYGTRHYMQMSDVLFITQHKGEKQANKNRKSLFLCKMRDVATKEVFRFLNPELGYYFGDHAFNLQLGSMQEEKRLEFMQKMDSGEIKGRYYVRNISTDE